jgi:hypothetical protein
MLCRFGGPGGRHYYNNTLSFDTPMRTWTELQCPGCIVGDVNPCMFWCGVDGRTGETAVVGKLNHLRFASRSHTTSSSAMAHISKHGIKIKRKDGHAMGSNVI